MKEFAEVLATNLLGACNFMRWSLPQMERRGFGRIINFAGGGAAYAYPKFTGYGVSKVGVVRLTETVAAEIEPTLNVTVNVIAPGAIATDLLKEVRQHGGEVRTTTSIEEPVRLVVFLAGPSSRHINGRFIHVRDGYRDSDLFLNKDMLTLRRVERR
jgi:NAD(P)-dependent dehydrogenase (short-subunit alcohol dehydrogenase family)